MTAQEVMLWAMRGEMGRERYQGFIGRHLHEVARCEHGVTRSCRFVRKALQ